MPASFQGLGLKPKPPPALQPARVNKYHPSASPEATRHDFIAQGQQGPDINSGRDFTDLHPRKIKRAKPQCQHRIGSHCLP